jgi:hypothetical protein
MKEPEMISRLSSLSVPGAFFILKMGTQMLPKTYDHQGGEFFNYGRDCIIFAFFNDSSVTGTVTGMIA